MTKRRSSSRTEDGFTLIEVMVAMAIAALALTGVAAAISQMIESASSMRERTYASWIAQNKIAELRLANVEPEVSENSGELQYAGRDWTWRATIAETGVEHLFRVDVAVSLDDSEEVVRQVTGFIGEPGIPGQSNLAWSRSTPIEGEVEGEER
jgi:general secretion pathway protein I